METKEYRVTAKAGEWVAGKRNPGPDKVLKLTVEQAHYALIAKEIEPVSAGTPAVPAEPETPAVPAAKPRK